MTARGFAAPFALVRLAQVMTGLLLGFAALAKLGDLAGLALEVHNFQLVPGATENLVAIVVPWIELLAALALVTGLHARGGAAVAAALLVVFTLAVAIALARGLDFECGCFGTASASRIGVAKLLQNLGMLALAIVGALPAAHTAHAVPIVEAP